MRNKLFTLIVITLIAIAGSIVVPPLSAALAYEENAVYTCPMHPHIVSETEGSCPICGMDLVAMEVEPIDEAEKEEGAENRTSGSNNQKRERKILYWVAPMDPNYRMDKPGKSPMGMDLVPVYEDEIDDSSGLDDIDSSENRVSVRISPEIIQNIGVRTEHARIEEFGKDIRSYGLVAENIRLKKDISSRVSGWIETLKITAVGDEVKEGDLLFTLYSPELVSAQQDYIAAVRTGVRGRINSAAKRLKSMGVQKIVIDNLKQKLRKLHNTPFYAESNGIVSKLNVREGSFVKSGENIAEIQDYSSVWIDVYVAEKDLQFLSKGDKAIVSFPNLGGMERAAAIDYIYPTIDASSRTGKVRLVLDNSDGTLRPNAYADIEFETSIDKRLAVPSEAILKSSDGDFVVVAKGKGRFQPVKVKTGITSKGLTEILSGIEEGENIVVSSQFLIDSESSLREAFRKMKRVEPASSSTEPAKNTDNKDTGGAHAGH